MQNIAKMSVLKAVNASIALMSMVVYLIAPLATLVPQFAYAVGPVTLFSDNFDQDGSGLSTNGWDNISGEGSGDRKTTSNDDFTVGVSSNGILLEGQGSSHSNDPDETAQHVFSTYGFSTLHISYSRAINSFESGDSFVAQYSLDGGVFVNLETLVSDQLHGTIIFDVDNPNRNTKIVVRFLVNGDEGNDEVGIDNFSLTGEGDPLFYDGFESNDFGAGAYSAWTTEETPLVGDSSGNSWTNNNTTANGHYANLDGSTGTNPDDAIFRTVDTTGYDNVQLRFARKVDNLATGENFKVYVSTVAGTPVWSEIDSLENVSLASVLLSLPDEADNNPNTKIRFEVNGNSSGDDAYLDDIVVWGDVYVPPVSTPPGSITVYKNVVASDETDVSDDNEFDVMLEGSNSQKISEGNSYKYDNLAPGTYTVAESIGDPDFDLLRIEGDNDHDASNGAEVTVVSEQNSDVTFVNKQKPGHIIVEKITNPANNTGFSFSASYNEPGFILESGQQNDSGPLVSGTYSVIEVENGFYVSTAVCSDGSEPNSIDLSVGETVTCTFTNTIKQAGLTIVKQTNPSDTDQSFDFDLSWDEDDLTLSSGGSENYTLDPGTYSVSEVNLPSGWDLTSSNCVDQDDEEFSPSEITLTPDGSVVCTFTNTQHGHLIVHKVTDPGNDETEFTITASGQGTVFGDATRNITGGESVDYEVTAGAYSVREENSQGWTLSENGCEDSKLISAGETEVCTIKNTKHGSITVHKNVVAADGETDVSDDHEFNVTLDGSNSQKISEENSYKYDNLAPRTYTVAEITGDPDFDLLRISNDNDDDASNGALVTVAAGENKDVTITNKRKADQTPPTPEVTPTPTPTPTPPPPGNGPPVGNGPLGNSGGQVLGANITLEEQIEAIRLKITEHQRRLVDALKASIAERLRARIVELEARLTQLLSQQD